MKRHFILPFIFSIFSISLVAQTKEDVSKIIETYDLQKIKERQEFFQKTEIAEKQKATAAAKINNWPIFIKNKNGTTDELMRLTPDGFPIYYTNNNVNAAKSTRATQLNTGGSLGLNLNGQGMVARVWDGGTVRSSHNFFSGRVSVVDDPTGTTYAAHATHVTGTILASNSVAAKGMAYQATARTFDWTNDQAEVLSEVQGGMLISNHSYGVPITSAGGNVLPSWYIGAYTQDAKNWDEIAHLSPYYLMVASAGNEGQSNANPNPITPGYDKLTGNKTAKNNLVVANAQDASVSADGTLTAAVVINSSSSQGPTDDRRIKPDITGNGTSVTSCNSTTNTSIVTYTGTSMASPNVAGTLLLLQQHYKNSTNNFMRAATLKGLACHTADDAGNPGPDVVFGWGLLNAKKAAQTISENGLTSWISEEVLNQGQTYTMNVTSDGVNPLMASVTWTDVPGQANNGTSPANDPTPALVNDLDIRITKDGTTYFPWKLDTNPTANAIRTADNNVDNVEQVKINVPVAGDYTITITHKGTLSGGSQNYALVVTGITSAFSINSTSPDLIVCSTQDAAYTFNYKQTGTGTTTFSAVGLPSGVAATFNSPSLSADGSVTMTLTGLSGIAPGEYFVGIIGDNGTETEIRYRSLKVYSNTFQPIVLNTPANGQTTVPTTVLLTWNNNVNAESYNLQVATNPNFINTLTNVNSTANSYQVTGLNQETLYYWRVIPSNRCGAATTPATVFSFQTGRLICGNVFTATDFSNAAIASVANSLASVPVEVTGGFTIGDMNVLLNITHTYIEDMTIYLQGPAAIGSPIIVLFQEACGDHDDMACTLDDAANAYSCSATSPAISGNVMPYQALSGINNLPADGIWTLHVDDPYNGDGGTINAFSLTICNLLPSLGLSDTNFDNLKIFPNPSKGILNVSFPAIISGITTLTLVDIQGRQILSKKTSDSNESLNIEHLQNGIYLLTIENGSSKTTKKIVLNQ